MPDGSAVIFADIEAPADVVDAPPNADGVLGLPVEVATWLVDVVAAGVTFDVLKLIMATLIRRGWRKSSASATAESVTRAINLYLRSCGYVDIVFLEVRLVSGHGWALNGTANGVLFQGLTDETGSIIHVRVQ